MWVARKGHYRGTARRDVFRLYFFAHAGSVREDQNQTIVEDDFQLICFDFVSEPSTPGAFMMKEARDYQNKEFTRADRINRLLNEVLNNEYKMDKLR